MFRTAVASAVALFVFVTAGPAAEVTGRLVKVDAEKNTITVSHSRTLPRSRRSAALFAK